MRSRYAAYALGLVEYIIQTTAEEAHAAAGDQAKWRKDIEAFCAATQFDALEVLSATQEEDAGSVTFVARLRAGGGDASFREESAFVRRCGKWLYLSGHTQSI